MSEYTERASGELVQPIILLVDKADPASHAEGVAAAALASVQAFLGDLDNPDWQAWAAGAFAKTVRRADVNPFAKMLAAHPDHALAEVGKGRAAGLGPMPADGLPKPLAKLQVSGTQLPAGPPLPDAPVTIALNASLDMSTGKAAAQAAHALFAWLLQADPATVRAWRAAGCPLSVRDLVRRDFRAGARAAAGPVIQDAGRTEIAPGSATAYVVVTL
ncbi:peptidyl-tRNA hydrolase [Arthrobacter sp. KK5.5]|uniref:peptidyl-tRNA hydrolase n=1 Tax=Arthrobacter sp. KK5.5 TaxID=3373084 RepID=UPI003EE803F3